MGTDHPTAPERGAEPEELRPLARAVERAIAQGCGTLLHLATPLGREVYRRKADLAARLCPERGRLLDWGCGFGQMSRLLRNRGFEVVSYTIEPGAPSSWNLFLREGGLDVVWGKEPVRLPFGDAAFDAVLACGVLEHVEDERGSLAELARVLRPGGRLVLMMLPNRWSWSEFLARRVFGVAFHERLYTMKGARALLGEHGFRAREMWYWNALPKNLSVLPGPLRRPILARPGAWLALDGWLRRTAPFRWFSGAIEGVFVREGRGES